MQVLTGESPVSVAAMNSNSSHLLTIYLGYMFKCMLIVQRPVFIYLVVTPPPMEIKDVTRINLLLWLAWHTHTREDVGVRPPHEGETYCPCYLVVNITRQLVDCCELWGAGKRPLGKVTLIGLLGYPGLIIFRVNNPKNYFFSFLSQESLTKWDTREKD